MSPPDGAAEIRRIAAEAEDVTPEPSRSPRRRQPFPSVTPMHDDDVPDLSPLREPLVPCAAGVYSARRRSAPTLERVAFKTSRLAEFCGQRELTAQTGHAVEDWPLVILKELVDNALDAAEEAQIAPEIDIQVSTERGEITIADNGPGIPAETIRDILDYSHPT